MLAAMSGRGRGTLGRRLAGWLGAARGEPLEAGEWQALCRRLRALPLGCGAARERLRERTAALLVSRRIDGAQGLAVERELALEVALLAALPVREIGLDWYQGWRTVVIYPGEFLAPRRVEDEAGVVHEYQEALAGEAWPEGPVLLSREDLIADRDSGFATGSVALHEFAHQIDLASGEANGRPPLHREVDPERWTRAFRAAFADLEGRARRGAPLPLPEDAVEDPGEFFAVASEFFFTAPARLHRAYPEVYAALRAFYRQEPRTVPAPPC